MHKTFLTLALLAGLASTAHAQRSIRARSKPSSGISLGLKGGGTLSELTGSDATEYESIYGFHAGVFANITLSKLLAFQPELLYAQKGAKRPFLTDYITRRFHYVDVPLLLHLNAGGFFLEGGPQVGFLVAAQDQYGSESIKLNRNAYKAAEIGYVAGLGFQKKAGLGFGLRYNGGLTNIPQRNSVNIVTFQPQVRNSALQLYLTYSFNQK